MRENISRYEGSYARWGAIAGIQNKKDFTEIEIVAWTLDKQGRPQARRIIAPGDFWRMWTNFWTPRLIAGREITVYGVVEGLVEGQIGERSYLFPLVNVEAYHLWETKQAATRYYLSPFHSYSPFYSPFGFYPYWGFGALFNK